MGYESSGGGQKAKRKPEVAPTLSPAAEARLLRGMAVLVGLVPLHDMTQRETDWVFRQKVRLTDG